MNPINYAIDVKSPFENVMQGFSVGNQIANMERLQQSQQLALQQQQAMQQDLANFAAKQNKTADDYSALTLKYPQLAAPVKQSFDLMGEAQQKQQLSQGWQLMSAIKSGNTDVATGLANKFADALENSGNTQDADAMRAIGKLIAISPEHAEQMIAVPLAAVSGKDFASNYSSLAKTPSDIAKTQADIGNISSQISERAARLGLDQDKLQSDVQLKLAELNQKMNPSLNLSADASKIINDSASAATVASQSAGQMIDLANRLRAAGNSYGALSSAGEWLKKATGSQNAMTAMRQEYLRIRNSRVSKMLPPGSASDEDISIVMSGFPTETADPASLAAFLRGMAKLQQYNSVAENAKSEWVNSVGNLGKARSDIEVDGVAVPAGTNFYEFSKKYLASKAENLGKQQQQSAIGSRPYMKYAQQGQQ